MVKKETQLNISSSSIAEKSFFNKGYAEQFIMPLLWQFRDKCHLLEAQRLIGAYNSIVTINIIANDEVVNRINTRMKLWQNY